MYKTKIYALIRLPDLKNFLGELVFMFNQNEASVTVFVEEMTAEEYNITMTHSERLTNEEIAEITDCFDDYPEPTKIEELYYNQKAT